MRRIPGWFVFMMACVIAAAAFYVAAWFEAHG